ncbi:flagellar basal body P-ring formation chaperone FlgA [Methylotenera sp. 73s]|uniref:flagellar basal body P-ring formation chaperone FlgA n=1 Tax=Methylotenera sp. 73s TaxID=1165096 RepID=UPI00036E7876|nr:flagellar basal body P-ring formation chaperone FlgA [Methylotenera sp. 73s]
MHCKSSKHLIKVAIVSLLTGTFPYVQAQEVGRENTVFQKQDISVLKLRAEDFLKRESNGHPGEVNVNVTVIDRNLKLAQCPNPEVSLPTGSRAWGKTSMVISCVAPKWTIYVPATVSVIAEYYVAAMPLSQGHVMMHSDLLKMKGDLTTLPAGIFTDANQVIGRTVSVSLLSGTVLKQEMLKVPTVIQQGQTVTLKTVRAGFEVSTEAKALNNAADGQAVQVKVVNGEVIAGIARNGGQVEVAF